ncbi:MAG: transposase [Chloroflexi bacterium]|nr:transposase [Chloroflexota bacterium]
MWLLAIGKKRHELGAQDIYEVYGQRYDLEHFFRFCKQKMLLASFQTPEDVREEKWWQLVHLAYAQLWVARHVTRSLPRPWERNLPAMKNRLMSPTLVQRDFGRIIRQIGTPAKAPKVRYISPGRPKGTKLTARPRRKVIVKSQQKAKPP